MSVDWFCPQHHNGFMVYVYGGGPRGGSRTCAQYCTQCLRDKLKSRIEEIKAASADRDARGLNGKLRYLMVKNRIAALSKGDSPCLSPKTFIKKIVRSGHTGS